MKKKLFYVLIASLICFTSGCAHKEALFKKEVEKTKTSKIEDKSNATTSTNPSESTSKGKEVTLSSEDRADLNSFFTVFSKAGIPTFEKGKLDNKNLILFGIRYNYINNSKALEKYEKTTAKLSEKYVDAAVEKYFGIKLKDHTIVHEDFGYTDGYYLVSYNLGIPNSFSQIESLVDEGNNLYTAYVNIYSAPPDFSGDPNGTMGEWKKLGQVPRLFMKVKATIKKVDSGYTLIEYLKA